METQRIVGSVGHPSRAGWLTVGRDLGTGMRPGIRPGDQGASSRAGVPAIQPPAREPHPHGSSPPPWAAAPQGMRRAKTAGISSPIISLHSRHDQNRTDGWKTPARSDGPLQGGLAAEHHVAVADDDGAGLPDIPYPGQRGGTWSQNCSPLTE